MSRESNLIKNTVILGIGTILPKFASIVMLPLLTGYLTKEEYGTYDLITVLVSLILPALTLQIQQAAFRFLIDARDSELNVSAIITSIMCFVVPVSTLGAAIIYFVMPLGNKLVTFLVCLYYWTDVVENALLQCARGMGDNFAYSMSVVICAFSQLFFALLFVRMLGLGLTGAAIMLLGADFLELVYIVAKTSVARHLNLRMASFDLVKQMLLYSWPLVPNSMSMWIMRLSNRLVITFFMGVASNAVFAVAYKLPQILTLVQHTFTMAWQENASIAEADDDKDAYYTRMFSAVYDLAAGMMALLIALSPLLFRLLIRGNYDEAFPHIPILFIGMFFYSMSGFLGGIYVAKKRTTSIGVTTVIAALINLVVDIVGVPFFGLYAASFAVLISYFILCVYRMSEVKKFANISYDISRDAAIAGMLVVMAALCYTQAQIAYGVNILIGLSLFVVLDKKYINTLTNTFLKRFAMK